jgi:hypothetical protein
VSVAREAEEASVLSVSAGVDGDSAAEVPAGAVTA